MTDLKMETDSLAKRQFDRQAQNFDNWSITRNQRILQSLFNFCGLKPGDTLLDAACGTGAFAIFSAKRIKEVKGVDISPGMIDIARQFAAQSKVDNIQFTCHDVENIPYGGGLFSVVVSKSAFHHIKNFDRVFSEMLRCCKQGGRVCIEDIIAYEDDKLDSFCENLESLIDISHHKTLSREDIVNLYTRSQVRVLRSFETESKLHFYEYVNHAVQPESHKQEIDRLVEFGLNDEDISRYFVKEGDIIYWKRKVFTIVGLNDCMAAVGTGNFLIKY